jgi:hypothetical protein
MADIPQVLATYDALVGVALGAGLTYGFGALNRRHQEAREDRTRWYEARLKVCAEFSQAAFDASRFLRQGGGSVEVGSSIVARFESSIGVLMLLGSPRVLNAGLDVLRLFRSILSKDESYDDKRFAYAVAQFSNAARKDLGHPSP